jgi:hypothetical protein
MSHQVVARTAATGALAMALGGTLTVLGSPAHSAPAGREVNLTFEDADLGSNSGNVSATADVVTANGGSIENAPGEDGGTAASFPSFAADDPPLAAMTVVDDSGADDLSPGTADFRFGVDFLLDQRSEGASSDNGNNLIQRGLYGAGMQYKLQVDGNRLSCRVAGSDGAVTVRSSHVVGSGVWYRAACARSGTDVSLRVIRLSDQATWDDSASGRIGTLEAPDRSTALSVGGKVDADGNLVSRSSDQFNGRLDNAFVNVF